MYQLIDTHAHMDEVEDLTRVLAKASEAGLVEKALWQLKPLIPLLTLRRGNILPVTDPLLPPVFRINKCVGHQEAQGIRGR